MVGNVDPVTTNTVVNQSVQKTDFRGDTVTKATEEQVAATDVLCINERVGRGHQ